ncbi:MAG: anaerobic glycerol-3-phosphate dehydrogenase subunit C [Elusimicrobia bacterium]|nr:anaerobic glycerol-3-phosphate dehydrogenase subunit C [Elusimicrobiota bacterium]
MTPRDAKYWDPADLGGELDRVFEICHGCRRCFNVCPSFGTLFKRIDAIEERLSETAGLRPAVSDASPLKPEGEHAAEVDPNLANLGDPVGALTEADRRQVVDECYECRLCFNLCPYHPPHRFDLDFPRLMLRAKAQRARREGVRWADRLLSRVDLVGALASLAAPIVNWLHERPSFRALLERTLGIHRERNLPRFASETFKAWWEWRGPKVSAGADRRVALFYTCSVNYNEPATGKDAVAVLERQGIEPVIPPQKCCGMPFLDSGDTERAARAARGTVDRLYPLVRQGLPVVTLGPTCSYMLKEEYPQLLGTPESRAVASKTMDIMEFLARLKRQGRLSLDFAGSPGKVAYQLPCHLKAQNIGFKSKEVLEAVPGTTVELIDRCSAHDGTWSMKSEYYELSLKYGAKLFDAVREAAPDHVATDCPLAALQIEKGTGRPALHPVRHLARAYGIRPDQA